MWAGLVHLSCQFRYIRGIFFAQHFCEKALRCRSVYHLIWGKHIKQWQIWNLWKISHMMDYFLAQISLFFTSKWGPWEKKGLSQNVRTVSWSSANLKYLWWNKVIGNLGFLYFVCDIFQNGVIISIFEILKTMSFYWIVQMVMMKDFTMQKGLNWKCQALYLF